MPRINTSASDPIDFCKRHMPSEHRAEVFFGNIRKFGEGPDGRGNCFGYDDEHPDYEDSEHVYRCHVCKKRLTAEDN